MKQHRFRIWRNLVLRRYRSQAVEYLRSTYKEHTGLELYPITIASIKRLDRTNKLRTFIEITNDEVVFYPNKSVLDISDDSKWPWNIPAIDYSIYGKDIWSCIARRLDMFDFVHLSMINKSFYRWFVKEDRRFEEFIDKYFWIYKNMSRKKILKTLVMARNYHIVPLIPLEFVFSCLFPFTHIQKKIVKKNRNPLEVYIEELDTSIQIFAHTGVSDVYISLTIYIRNIKDGVFELTAADLRRMLKYFTYLRCIRIDCAEFQKLFDILRILNESPRDLKRLKK